MHSVLSRCHAVRAERARLQDNSAVLARVDEHQMSLFVNLVRGQVRAAAGIADPRIEPCDLVTAS